jgi:DnaK suppressor protein
LAKKSKSSKGKKAKKAKKVKKAKKAKKVKKATKARKVQKVKKVKKAKKAKKAVKAKKTAKAGKKVKAKKVSKPAGKAKPKKLLFKKKDLDIFKHKLLLIQAKITGDVSHLEKDALMNTREASGDLSGYSLHMADVATDNYDQELNLGLASSEQGILNLIDEALRRLDEGTYGYSTKSGKPISKKRLTAVPYAELTIEEQEEEEKNQIKGV